MQTHTHAHTYTLALFAEIQRISASLQQINAKTGKEKEITHRSLEIQ